MECATFQLIFELFGETEVSFVYIFLFILFSRFIFLSVKIRVVDPRYNVEL